MPLTLPRVHILLSGPSPRALASRSDLLAPAALKRLVAYDVKLDAPESPIDRVLPIGDAMWAIGRRKGQRAVWRLVTTDELSQVHHPAWLWTEPSWFDASNPDRLAGPTPSPEPLRFLMRHAASLGGSRKHTIRALAAAVAGLRRQKRAMAVVVPPQALQSSNTPARWFMLALLATLPATLRLGLRVSVGDPNPDPRLLDLIVTTETPRGFRLVDATDPPDEGRDLVAYYVRNRLHANDPEAVETAAELYDGPADQDAWGDGIRKLIRGGVPGVSAVSEEMIERDPDGAMRAIRARLRAGAPLDDEIVGSLVELTVAHGDHRPWRPLVIRPAVERARAVSTLLERVDEIQPRKELLEVLGAIQPRGSAFPRWCEVLLDWMRTSTCTSTALDILREALVDWPKNESEVDRITLWTKAIRNLMELRQYDEAQDRLHDDVAMALGADGHATQLAGLWAEIPAEHRALEHLEGLIDLIDCAEDRNEAIPALVRAARGDADEMRAVVARWSTLAATPLPPERSLDGSAPNGGDPLASWLQSAIGTAGPADLARLAATLANPNDPIWLDLELAQARQLGDPRSRFVGLKNLERGLSALEPTALALIATAIGATTFPDPGIAEVALLLLELADRSEIWPWVAITASAPQDFDDGTIDATVVAFLEQPPDSELEIDIAHAATRALGLAGAWAPLEHARWLARIILAPDAGIGLNDELALTLIRSVAHRPDAIERMSVITHAFLELPPDHVAVRTFASRLLPNTWEGGPPPELVRAIDPYRLQTLPPIWSRALRLA